MIGSSKNNRENYPRKCFWTQEKETRVKFNPGLSANRPSNNWALAFTFTCREGNRFWPFSLSRVDHAVRPIFMLWIIVVLEMFLWIVSLVLIVCQDPFLTWALCQLLFLFIRPWTPHAGVLKMPRVSNEYGILKENSNESDSDTSSSYISVHSNTRQLAL